MLIRYLLVGILNTIICLSIIFICFDLVNLNYQLSYLIGFICGTINSFIINRTFTFKSNSNWRNEIILFLVTIFVCYLISHIFLIVLIEKMFLNQYFSFVLSTSLYTISSFVLLKKLFKN